MARTWRQRFDVTATGGGAGDDPLSAGAQITAADAKVVKDFRAGLITADQAMGEYTAALRRMARDAQLTIETRQRMAGEMEGKLDFEAANRTAAGSPTAGVSKDKEYSWTGMEAEFSEVNRKFQDRLISAEDAAKEFARIVKEFGDALQLTVGQRKILNEGGKMAVGQTDEQKADAARAEKTEKWKAWREGKGPSPFDSGGKGGRGGGGKGGGGGGGGDTLGNAIGGEGEDANTTMIAAAAKAVQAGANAIRDAAQATGRVGTAVANNDGKAIQDEMFDGIAKMERAVPVIGEAMASVTEMDKTLANLPGQLSAALIDRAQQIKGYSGAISAQDAVGRTNKLLMDIQEAQTLGNQYSELMAQQNAQELEMQKALIPVKALLMDALIPIMKVSTVQIKLVGEFTKKLATESEVAFAAILTYLRTFANGIPAVKAFLDKFDKLANPDAPANGLIDELLNAGRRAINAGQNFPDPKQEPANRPLGIPLLDRIRNGGQ